MTVYSRCSIDNLPVFAHPAGILFSPRTRLALVVNLAHVVALPQVLALALVLPLVVEFVTVGAAVENEEQVEDEDEEEEDETRRDDANSSITLNALITHCGARSALRSARTDRWGVGPDQRISGDHAWRLPGIPCPPDAACTLEQNHGLLVLATTGAEGNDPPIKPRRTEPG